MEKNTFAAPPAKAISISCAVVSNPSHAATGTLTNTAKETALHTSMTGRLWRRSTHAPACSTDYEPRQPRGSLQEADAKRARMKNCYGHQGHRHNGH